MEVTHRIIPIGDWPFDGMILFHFPFGRECPTNIGKFIDYKGRIVDPLDMDSTFQSLQNKFDKDTPMDVVS